MIAPVVTVNQVVAVNQVVTVNQVVAGESGIVIPAGVMLKGRIKEVKAAVNQLTIRRCWPSRSTRSAMRAGKRSRKSHGAVGERR